MNETRNCLSCNGKGEVIREAFISGETTHPKSINRCSGCNGLGTFTSPDEPIILAAIRTRRGLRSSRPRDSRQYYVWRMARFAGGADVTLPMMAAMEIRHDPFKPELDALADHVAHEVYGTELAGAHRWGHALGTLERDQGGLPDTAYSGGPVVTQQETDDEDRR